MVSDAVEVIAGCLLVLATLADVFATVVIPRPLAPFLSAPKLIRQASLPFWLWNARRAEKRFADTILTVFAGFLLLSSFAVWLGLLLAGYSLIAHGLRAEFSPPLESWPETIYQAGSAMITLGLSGHTAGGWSRAVMLVAGVSGLLVVTLTLTYILQIQAALRDRDGRVLVMSARAGAPPSGVKLLQTLGHLDLKGEIGDLFARWEEWAADLLHSHTAHPVLGYFRSGVDRNDWLSSLGAVLDASALVLAAVEDCHTGRAQLFQRTGSRAARDLCRLYALRPVDIIAPDPDEMNRALRRLQSAGFRVRGAEEATAAFGRLRAGYAGEVQAMAEHFGIPPPRWAAHVEDEPQLG